MPAQITENLVEGGAELAAGLRALAADAQGALLARALKRGGRVVQKHANQRAPRPEVKLDVDNAGGANQSVSVGIEGKNWRWRFAEYGVQPFEVDLVKGRTSRASGGGRKTKAGVLVFNAGGNLVFTKRIKRGGVPAKTFLRPAIDENEDEILREIGAEIQEGINNRAAT